MTGADFKAWRVRLGFSRTKAADSLGIGRNQPRRYEDGMADIPKYIALACAAIALGIPPIGERET